MTTTGLGFVTGVDDERASRICELLLFVCTISVTT